MMDKVYALRWICEIVSLHATEKSAEDEIDRRVADGDERDDYAVSEEDVAR